MPSNLLIPLMLAAMAVFMFMSIRNQKKRAAAASEMQSSVVPGSRVQLHSGLFGTVVDPSGEEFVTIEIAPGVVTEWNRLAIREVITADEGGADAPVADDADDVEVPDSPAALDKLTKKTDDESGDKPEEK